MNKLYPEHLQDLANQIKDYKIQYPKADIFFNLDAKRIEISLPLPKDFPKLINFKIEDTPSLE